MAVTAKDLYFNLCPIDNPNYKETMDDDTVVAILKAVARGIHQCVYILDYEKGAITHVEGNMQLYFNDISRTSFKTRGLGIYADLIPKNELETIALAIKAGNELINPLSTCDRQRCIFTMDLHMHCGDTLRMVNHHLTPIALDSQGRISLALCTISPSSKRIAGSMYLKVDGEKYFFEFSTVKKKWLRNDIDDQYLSDIERRILQLALQGDSETEMAKVLLRSVSSIKMYKRRIFDKLGADNITQAVVYALNYKLL